MAKQFLSAPEMNRLFADEGKILENAARYRDAEQLYISSKQLDLALSMYQHLKHYDNVIGLISIHKPDQVAEVHTEIAWQLQRDGNRKLAEKHYLAVIYHLTFFSISRLNSFAFD